MLLLVHISLHACKYMHVWVHFHRQKWWSAVWFNLGYSRCSGLRHAATSVNSQYDLHFIYDFTVFTKISPFLTTLHNLWQQCIIYIKIAILFNFADISVTRTHRDIIFSIVTRISRPQYKSSKFHNQHISKKWLQLPWQQLLNKAYN